MSFWALALVVLAGLIHALWNVAAKKAGGGSHFIFLTSAVILVVWAPVGVWFIIHHTPHWQPLQWAFIVGSAAIHVIYFLVLLRGYRVADLSVVYPVARGSGPLISSALAIVLLGEVLHWNTALGVLIMVSGIFLIASGPQMLRRVWTQRGAGPGAAVSSEEHRLAVKGVGYGLLTGLTIAAYTLIDGYAVKMLLISPVLVDYLSQIFRMMILSPWVLQDWAELRRAWQQQGHYALIVGTLGPVAYVMVLFAMQMAPLSHVAPAREISMLFAALLGGHLLGERAWKMRAVGAMLMATGVMLLALS